MNWLIIGILLFIVLVVFRVKEVRHRVGLLIVTLLLLFFALSAYQVYSSHKVNLASFDGLVDAGKLYTGWLANVFHSASKVTGYATHQEWGLNVTNQSLPSLK